MRTQFLTLALAATGKTKTAVAREMGISRQGLYQILNQETAVNFNTLVRFLRALGWTDAAIGKITLGDLYNVNGVVTDLPEQELAAVS